MAQSGTLKRLYGPAFIAAAAANIYNLSSALIYTSIRQIHLVNVTGGAITPTLYLGATGASAAGTEQLKNRSIPANDFIDLYFPQGLKLVSTDFLTGLDGNGAAIVITIMGEQVVV